MRTADSSAGWDDWAEYYDLMDGDRTAMISFYSSLVTPPVRRVLEIACGTGRVAMALAQVRSGVEVVGVDESPRMLEIARKREPACKWLHGDMISLSVPGKFDLIICCYNSMQHLLSDADFVRMLSSVRALLPDAGVFAFDIYKPNSEYLNRDQSGRVVRSATDPVSGKRLEIRENTRFDPQKRVYFLDWHLLEKETSKELAHLEYRYRQYSSEQLEELLERAGLKVHRKYGAFDYSPLGGNSIKQIVLAVRDDYELA